MISVRETLARWLGASRPHIASLIGANAVPSRKTLFDPVYYLDTYPDVAAAGIDPYWHYLHHGVAEGRAANAFFDTQHYLSQTVDRPRDPTCHYLKKGVAAGLDPHPHFDTRWYLSTYPDVALAGMNPLAHYLQFGKSEARLTAPVFRRSFGAIAGFPRGSTDGFYRRFCYGPRAGALRDSFARITPAQAELHERYILLAAMSEGQRSALRLALAACTAPRPVKSTLELAPESATTSAIPSVALIFSCAFIHKGESQVRIDAAGVLLYVMDANGVRLVQTYGPLVVTGIS